MKRFKIQLKIRLIFHFPVLLKQMKVYIVQKDQVHLILRESINVTKLGMYTINQVGRNLKVLSMMDYRYKGNSHRLWKRIIEYFHRFHLKRNLN